MRKSLILQVFLLMPGIAFAGPSISGVSGTIAHKNTIIISGSNFGMKSPAKPLIWAPFEDDTIMAESSLSASPSNMWTNPDDNMELTSADLPHAQSKKAIRGIPWDGTTKRSVVVRGNSNSDVSKLFIFNRRKYAHASFLDYQVNYKFYRFWSETDIQPDSFLIYHNFVLTTTGQTKYNIEVSPESVEHTLTNNRGINNKWFVEEVQASHSDIDTSNGTMRYWVNGTKYEKTSVKTRITGKSDLWRRWYIQNHWTSGRVDPAYDQYPPVGAYVYFDDIYMDTTWSRVMIGNAPTFDACTHREPLIPMAWSASSITAMFNQGSFPNASKVYLFVIDSDGNASLGKEITIGGTASGGVTTAPNPPGKLTINN